MAYMDHNVQERLLNLNHLLTHAGFVKDCSISSALALEILQFCTKLLIHSASMTKQERSQLDFTENSPYHTPTGEPRGICGISEKIVHVLSRFSCTSTTWWNTIISPVLGHWISMETLYLWYGVISSLIWRHNNVSRSHWYCMYHQHYTHEALGRMKLNNGYNMLKILFTVKSLI